VENMLAGVLYAEGLQEAGVQKEHKALKECKQRTCIIQIKYMISNSFFNNIK